MARTVISLKKSNKIQTVFRNWAQQIFNPALNKPLPKDKNQFQTTLTAHEKSVLCRTCGNKQHLSPGFEYTINIIEIKQFKKKHENCTDKTAA